MGQYFVLVNLDKKEIIRSPLSKLWEWCANNWARLLVWLVAKGPQDGTSLCKFEPEIKKAEERFFNSKDEEERVKALEKISEIALLPIGKGYFKTCGRWAGDRIVLIGDYDESKLYDIALKEYKDITEEVIKEFNEFIETDEYKIPAL